MKSRSFPEIMTSRLLLRKLKVSDWNEIVFLRSDENVNKYVKRPQAKNKDEALAYIAKILTGIENEEWIQWCITLKGNLGMIGTISLWNFSDDRKTAEVGYDLDPEFQGKGIMDEALKRVIDFGFYRLNLEKIEAFTHFENESSKKLLLKNRFEFVKNRKDDDDPDNVIFELRR